MFKMSFENKTGEEGSKYVDDPLFFKTKYIIVVVTE